MVIDWQAIESEHPALADLPEVLRQSARLRSFNRGQVLFHQGKRPTSMILVLAGEIRLLRRTPAGSEMILQRVSRGFIAEASLDAKAYHCDIIAANDSQVLLFPRETFKAALEHNAAFNQRWIGQLALEVRHLRARCERLSLNSAAERILHYLEAEGVAGAVTLTQTRKAWAAELGLSHEVLYRSLRTLREAGVIRVDGQRIALQ